MGANSSTLGWTTPGYSYDAAGNMTADGSHTYQWDAEGRLESIDNGSTETEVYNALGQWVESRPSAYNMEQLYDPAEQVTGIYNSTGYNNNGVPYWWGENVRLGGRLLAYNICCEYREVFLHKNALGTTTLTMDHGGNVLEDQLLYPWGQMWTYAGQLQGYGFAGLDYTNSTGLYPTLNRMYTTTLGRWLTPDPLAGDISNPQSLNRYAYALNNPTTLIDPLGLESYEPPNPCGSPFFADSHAECAELPGGFGNPFGLGIGFPIGGGGGGGGGGTIGGNSQNTGGPVRPFPAGGLPTSPCTINGDPVSCPQSPLWVLVLAAPPPFLIAITSTGQVPHTPGSGVLGAVGGFLGGIASTTYNSAISPNGCINQFFWNTLGNLNPFTPSASSLAEPAANAISAFKFNSALVYAASRPNYLGGTGLLYPFKSGVFRSLVNSAQGVLEATPVIQLDLALGQALYSEYEAAKAGECQ